MVDSVLTEISDRVGIITLNRPDAMNAWNGALCRQLDSALEWAASNDDIGAIVVTGAGRAFCAGADLSTGGDTFAAGTLREANDDMDARTPKILPWDVPKPVVAAINGKDCVRLCAPWHALRTGFACSVAKSCGSF